MDLAPAAPGLADVTHAAHHPRVFLHDPALTLDPGFLQHSPQLRNFHLERALWLAEPDDLVVVTAAVDAEYLTWMRGFGQSPQTCIVPAYEGCLSTATLQSEFVLARMRSWYDSLEPHAGAELSLFCHNEHTARFVDQLSRQLPGFKVSLGNVDFAQASNTKAFLRTAYADLNIPLIPGTVVSGFESRQERNQRLAAAVDEYAATSGRAVVKANYASAGQGVLVTSPDESVVLQQWLENWPDEQVFLVEEFVPFESSPNLQFWLSDSGQTHYLGCTDQVFAKGLEHTGNGWPAAGLESHELFPVARRVAQRAADGGIRGVLGLDFLVLPDKSVRLVEINARYNGSTYALAIAHRINRARSAVGLPTLPCGLMRGFACDALSGFEALMEKTADLVVDPAAERAGVVPYVPGALAGGHCYVVTLGHTQEEAAALEEEFMRRIGGG